MNTLDHLNGTRQRIIGTEPLQQRFLPIAAKPAALVAYDGGQPLGQIRYEIGSGAEYRAIIDLVGQPVPD